MSQQDYYEKLSIDLTKHLCNLIKITVLEGENLGYINSMQPKFLINTSPRIPLFYTLPKIHKKVAFPPGRPIANACSTALEPIMQFADSFFKAFVVEAKSYVKDSTDFISKVEGL